MTLHITKFLDLSIKKKDKSKNILVKKLDLNKS